MSLQHIQKNSPRLLPKPAKFEKNPPNGYRVIRKTKCGAGRAGGAAGAGGAGGARCSPIHKQASLAGRLINVTPGHCTPRHPKKCTYQASTSYTLWFPRYSPDKILKVKVTTARSNQGHTLTLHTNPQPRSLPSFIFLHLTVSEI